MSSLCSPDEIRVLFLEPLEVLLGLPVPDRVAGKHQIHLLKCPLVRFRVQGPDDDNAEGVDGAEDIQSLFVEFLEDGG